MNLTSLRKGQLVSLVLPPALPRKTMDGTLHEGGQVYRVLGLYSGSFVRLSRVADKAKLIIEPETLALVKDVKPMTVKEAKFVGVSVVKPQTHWTESL